MHEYSYSDVLRLTIIGLRGDISLTSVYGMAGITIRSAERPGLTLRRRHLRLSAYGSRWSQATIGGDMPGRELALSSPLNLDSAPLRGPIELFCQPEVDLNFRDMQGWLYLNGTALSVKGGCAFAI